MPRTASQSSQHRYTNQEMKRSRSSSNAKERAKRVLESDVPLRIQRLQPVQIPMNNFQRDPMNQEFISSKSINFSDVFHQESTAIPSLTPPAQLLHRSDGLGQLRTYQTPPVPPYAAINPFQSQRRPSPTVLSTTRRAPPFYSNMERFLTSGSQATRAGSPLAYSQMESSSGPGSQATRAGSPLVYSHMGRNSGSGSQANRTDSPHTYINGGSATERSVDSGSEVDQIEQEASELVSMFDAHILPTMSAAIEPKGKRGKVRTIPYAQSERAAKNKGHSRAIKTIKKRLNYLIDVHPDTEFFFYARTSARQSVLVVSKGLEGIDTSRSLGVIHGALDDFQKNKKHINPVSYDERFPAPLPFNANYDDALVCFQKSQTAKTVKPIYTMLQKAGIIKEPRLRSVKLEWYMERLKPLFQRESRISSAKLWDAFKDLQYHGSTGVGYKYSEVKRKHFVGLMQSIDLLAIARGEPPLPHDVDFAGNRLRRGEEVVISVPAAGTCLNAPLV